MVCDKCDVIYAMWQMQCDKCDVTNAIWQIKCDTCNVTNAIWQMQCDNCNMTNAMWQREWLKKIVENSIKGDGLGTHRTSFPIIFSLKNRLKISFKKLILENLGGGYSPPLESLSSERFKLQSYELSDNCQMTRFIQNSFYWM